jgi:DNA photolyase
LWTQTYCLYVLWQVSRDEVKTEERVEKALEKEGIEIKYFWGSTLYHIDDLPFDLQQMPTNYGGFREKVSAITVRKSIEAPQHLKGLPARGGVEPGEIPTLAELGVSAPPAVTQVCVNVLTLATCVKKKYYTYHKSMKIWQAPHPSCIVHGIFFSQQIINPLF